MKLNQLITQIDFRQLNKITKTIAYPLTLIDDILAQLGSLDLKSGYWELKMTETDREKTALCCHRGLFEFNVMPFGFVNAPSIFRQLIAIALQGLEKR